MKWVEKTHHQGVSMKASIEDQMTHMLARFEAKEIQTRDVVAWAKTLSQTVEKHWPPEQLSLKKAYLDVWLDLLDRLESSALFTEESCSFSHADLLQAMNKWVQKVASITQM
ncbi:MAG: hypothetical protein WCL48_04515 [Betaproteobacteria bacterium]|jgi:hypothetical protein